MKFCPVISQRENLFICSDCPEKAVFRQKGLSKAVFTCIYLSVLINLFHRFLSPDGFCLYYSEETKKKQLFPLCAISCLQGMNAELI